jgi:myo-inositol 2-dehydrogenase / D-chiro-inositol 1-dehydrogenase
VPAPTLAFAGSGIITPIHVLAGQALGIKPVAWASRQRANAQTRANAFGGRVVAYHELPAGADMVVVATPPALHLDHVCIALTGGAAVVLEKPLCTTLDDADAIVALAASHGDQVFYAENMAFSPVVQHMIQATGAIGPLNHVEARTLNAPAPYLTTSGTAWGGGALFDLGAHPLAVVLLLASASQPQPARVTEVRCTLEGSDTHPYDEYADVEVRFDTGCTGRVISSFRELKTAIWDAQASSADGVVRAEIMPGTSLERNGEPIALPPVTTALSELERFGYIGQLQAFARNAAERKGSFMNAAFGRFVLDVLCAAYASAGRNGEPVAVPFTGPRNLTPHQLWRGP